MKSNPLRLRRATFSPPLLTMRALTAAGLLLGLAPNEATAGPVEIAGWELVYQDEFDGTSVNTSDWLVMDRQNSFNNEKQYYTPDQVTVSNGNLVITATDTPLGNKDYRSGLIDSYQQWSYGRFEARIDLPTGQGMWPAFWLLPDTSEVPWPSGGEIDIMENRGSQPTVVNSAYHWGPDFFGRDLIYDDYSATYPDGSPVNYHDSFHDYAVEWEPGVLRFYVDGVNYHTITESSVGYSLGNNADILDTPKSIILNLAVGGDYGGDPDNSTAFPQQMLVDYVRVWQRPENTPVGENLLSNGSLDDVGGSLNDWGTFGNEIGNVSASTQLALDGTHAVKLFGQFNGQTNYSGITQGVAITEGTSLQAQASIQTPSFDSLAGKSNEVLLKIEFYSVFGGDYGSADFISEVVQVILDGNTTEDVWLDHALDAVAPAGAVEARVTVSLTQPSNENGAAWIDQIGLFALADLLAGDYNGDGFVSQSDLDLVLLNWGDSALPAGFNPSALDGASFDGLISQNELDGVLLNWGDGASPNLSAIPEPSTAALAMLSTASLLRRRRSAR